MFTGIITGMGQISAVQPLGDTAAHGKRLVITPPAGYLDDVGLGDSIALNGALVRAGLVDELLLYLAPKLLGPGRGMADMGPLETLAQGLALQFQDVDRLGPDLRVLARVAGRDAF